MSGRRILIGLFILTLPLVTFRIRGADEIEYFSHLRSAVFDHDLDFGNEYRYFYERDPEGLAGFKSTFLDRTEPLTGHPINFTPVGSALLWSPFYLTAHVGVRLAQGLGSAVSADGFSLPYVAAVCLASALFGLLGLLLIHDTLRRHAGVDEDSATIATIAVWFGTPVLYYMTLAPGFSHATSLFVVSLLVWLWLRVRHQPSLWGWTVVGIMGGVAGLVREQDVLFLAPPALDLLLMHTGKRRIREGLTSLLGMVLGCAIALVPQFAAYRVLNGSWGPSGLVRRKMNYSSPHFFQVLFDSAHGLFVWTPLLAVAAVGLGILVLRRQRAPLRLLTIALLLQVWINGSLESWTQAGAFGSRRFVSATIIFAWGLAYLADRCRRRWGTPPVALAAAVFVWWNVSLMVQFGLRLMDRQRLDWPLVATNQLVAVPQRAGRTAWLFLTDRERLVRETR